MESLRFLSPNEVDEIRIEFGTLVFVYDEATLRENARTLKAFPNAFVLKPRYAMKAALSAAIIRIFNQEGLGIDASSGHESEHAIRVGFGTESLSLGTQEMPEDFRIWVDEEVSLNLCSLNQIKLLAKTCHGRTDRCDRYFKI
jgi:diaminopimelate decarboxylase